MSKYNRGLRWFVHNLKVTVNKSIKVNKIVSISVYVNRDENSREFCTVVDVSFDVEASLSLSIDNLIIAKN